MKTADVVMVMVVVLLREADWADLDSEGLALFADVHRGHVDDW